MAKIFDVSTINGSRLTENTAGIESTAKATSVVSITKREQHAVAFLVICSGVKDEYVLKKLRLWLDYEAAWTFYLTVSCTSDVSVDQVLIEYVAVNRKYLSVSENIIRGEVVRIRMPDGVRAVNQRKHRKAGGQFY